MFTSLHRVTANSIAKAKETLLVLTGAKLAFKKLVDALEENPKPQADQNATSTDIASSA